MMADDLRPVVGCWVNARHGEGREQHPGQVLKITEGAGIAYVTVRWLRSRNEEVLPVADVGCGLQPGHDVLHVPRSQIQRSYGLGRVLTSRTLGHRHQLLVDFPRDGERVWLPWQRLRFAKGPVFRLRHGDWGGAEAPERLRLRNLAFALQLWNENTGSLSRFDIDPLPHQIHLVHHILSSGNFNWLIADDVGLGKTIEAGLLIAALRQRRIAKRILIVVPAGLTRQWQEDLKLKFGMSDFLVYGADFTVADPVHWKLYERVIASMDRLKSGAHLEALMEAGQWDLVIFDEAHRLTRRQNGRNFERSERYRLAEALRPMTEHMLLLTATPHQGRNDQFSALLELLRPEMRQEFSRLDENPDLLSDMVFRNRKSEVIDQSGKFVFHGQTSRMIRVERNEAMVSLESELRSYLRRGYQTSESLGGSQARAIGFVMTIYRKLAASSVVTLQKALQRRLTRLRGEMDVTGEGEDPEDERFEGEWEERRIGFSDPKEFFSGEIEQLERLIGNCSLVAEDDHKIQAFMDKVIHQILQRNPDEHVLIFSEYRGTQDYIVDVLARRFGSDAVHVVNGSMGVEERLDAIQAFEEQGQFLVSTEAGGEGINLQRCCHMLVNYDLPWNPMRLAQRIGRLYRYGQQKHVLAFNLQGEESADEQIVGQMYQRLERVARDMASVDDANQARLVGEIVGELADLVDVEEILKQAVGTTLQQTEQRIDDALERAKDAAELQRKLFAHAASFDAAELEGAFQVGLPHLRAFVFGMVRLLGGSVNEARSGAGNLWRLTLPEQLSRGVPGVGSYPLVRFEREVTDREDAILLDLDHPLVISLLEHATHYDFQGLTASVDLSGAQYVSTSVLRWQDDAGRRLRQEFLAVMVDPRGTPVSNGKAFSDWLLTPVENQEPRVDRPEERAAAVEVIDAVHQRLLAERSDATLQPENAEWLTAASSTAPLASHGDPDSALR
jgi:superfamily II DNA or RNA helicase